MPTLRIKCCDKQQWLLLYYSPIGLKMQCKTCKKNVVVNNPPFPFDIGAYGKEPMPDTDEGLVALVKEQKKEIEELKRGNS